MTPLVEIRGVDVQYGDFPALRNVSLTIGQGRIVSVIGANGAGKSTLLKAIAGSLTPSRGEILYHGEIVNRLEAWRIAARGVAYVPEGRRIFPRLTVLENLLVGAHPARARRNRGPALEKAYALFPILKERAGRLGAELSGGEQQMLAVARALMSDPEIILFDEISLGLAPLVIRGLYEKVRELNRAGLTVVLVDQDVRRALDAADRACVLRRGRVVLDGPPADLGLEMVNQAYFGN